MLMRHSAFVAALWAGALIGGRAVAQSAAPAQHFPNNEDLRHTRAVDDPQLSPDGRFVLATVAEPTVDGAKRHLWIVDVASRRVARALVDRRQVRVLHRAARRCDAAVQAADGRR